MYGLAAVSKKVIPVAIRNNAPRKSPNCLASANSTEWPLYTPSAPDSIVFDVNSTGLAYTEVDNYREAAITYLQENVYN
jgi:hypothetical protein